MKNKKILITILMVLAILLAVLGIVFLVSNKEEPTSKEKNKEEAVEKESSKETINGEVTNTEEKLTKERKFNGLILKNITVTEKDEKYYFKVTIVNDTNKQTEETPVKLSFLSNTGKELGYLNIMLPRVNKKDKVELSIQCPNSKFLEAYDLKIEKEKIAS